MPHLAPPSRVRFVALAAPLACALVVVAGCPAGGGASDSKSRGVFEETLASDPSYLRYGLQISKGTSSPFALQKLIEAAAAENYQTALEAVKALGEHTGDDAQNALRQVFENRPGALRLQAAIHLAGTGDAAAIDFLKEQLADPVQSLHLQAVKALAEADGESFVRPIIERRMANDSLAIRNEAYVALGAVEQPWAATLLVNGLKREHGEDRQQVIEAIGRCGDPGAAAEIERYVNTQGLVFATLEALGALGSETSLAAVRTMKDNDEAMVRVYAGVALWRLGQKSEALEVLDPLMQSEDATVRQLLAEQLAPLDDPDASSRLLTLAEDSDKGVKVAAIRSIAVDPDPSLQPALLEAAQSNDYEIQTLALNILAKIGSGDAVASLVPLLDAENAYVKLSAAHAILSINGRAEAESAGA